MEPQGNIKDDGRHAVIGVVSPGDLSTWNHVHSLATVNCYRTTRNQVKVSYSEATPFSRTGISYIDIRPLDGCQALEELLTALRLRLINEGWVLMSQDHLFMRDGSEEVVPA